MFIDYIDKLQLSEEYAEKHGNELNSLRYLARGLGFLNDQILKIEAEIAERTPKGRRVFHFGNSPDLEGIPQDLVACAFHWYAVTVCNYVKMVGWLANNGDSTKAREYMEHVLPEVHLWRHKVAAHFAIIDPRKYDNAADVARYDMCSQSSQFSTLLQMAEQANHAMPTVQKALHDSASDSLLSSV